MKVPFTLKVTGWFMVGGSAEFPTGDAKPYMAMRKWATQFYEVPPAGAVVGPNAGLAALAAEARREALPNIERLLPAARNAGVKVVHCLVQHRPDGLGGNHNAKIFAIGGDIAITPGTPGAELLPEFGPAPTDLVLRRSHGIGPMGGTDLAITNLCTDAVNKAHRVIVPRDAVAGIPTDYAAAIIDNMLSLRATITTTDELIGSWT